MRQLALYRNNDFAFLPEMLIQASERRLKVVESFTSSSSGRSPLQSGQSSQGTMPSSEKARVEMEADGITELDVAESILNAVAIFKRLRSRSPFRTARVEHLYVIHSTTWKAS